LPPAVVPAEVAVEKKPTVVEKKIEETGPYFQIKAKYPFFGQKIIDGKVENFVKEQIAEFKKNADLNKDYPPAVNSEAKYDFIGNYNFSRSAKTLGVKLEIYQYTGGAHGNTIYTTFNYDLADNKMIGLADIFIAQSNYLNIISKLAIADLKNILDQDGFADNEWLAAGAGPKAENFSAFMIVPAGLEIYFSPYQVAPYAAGAQTIAIPGEKIKEIIRPEYLGLIFE
jgi:hypothetical protein